MSKMSQTLAERIAGDASTYVCQAGDVFLSPRGEPLYSEPGLILPGYKALAFMLRGKPVGILIFRPGDTKLRYCDREGIIHNEPVRGDNEDATMVAGMKRMSEIFSAMLGERHPLAEAASSNRIPA